MPGASCLTGEEFPSRAFQLLQGWGHFLQIHMPEVHPRLHSSVSGVGTGNTRQVILLI